MDDLELEINLIVIQQLAHLLHRLEEIESQAFNIKRLEDYD